MNTARFLRFMCLAAVAGAASSCAESDTIAADAGPPPSIAPALAPPPEVAPAPLASQPRAPVGPQADADGCFPYWREVELGCNERAIHAALRKASATRVCDPTHERATRAVLTAMLHRPAQADDPAVREYLRGVAWNDDPESLLFESATGPEVSTAWCRRFQAAQLRARQGHVAGASDSLLDRSQFGDLQFLHGLASRPGEKAIDTYERIMGWLELAYRIATGEIAGDTTISNVPVKGIAALLPKQGATTVSRLFGVDGEGDVKARALGSLLHVLQDLTGSGHIALRPVIDRATPKVDHFYTYAGVTHPHHQSDEGWREAWENGSSVDDVPGLRGSVERGIDIIRLVERKAAWPTVKLYLDRFYFELTDFQAPAVRWGRGSSK